MSGVIKRLLILIVVITAFCCLLLTILILHVVSKNCTASNQHVTTTRYRGTSLAPDGLEAITKNNLHRLVPLILLEGEYQPRFSVAFNSDGTLLAAGGDSIVPVSSRFHCGSVWVYEIVSGEFITRKLDAVIQDVSFGPDRHSLAFLTSEWFAVPGIDNVVVWDIVYDDEYTITQSEDLCRVVFHPTNSMLYIFSRTGLSTIWHPINGEQVYQDILESKFSSSPAPCQSKMSYSPDRSLLIIPHRRDSGYLEFVDTELEGTVPHIVKLDQYLPQFVEQSFGFDANGKSYPIAYMPVRTTAFSPDGKLLAIAIGSSFGFDNDGAVQIWGVPVGYDSE